MTKYVVTGGAGFIGSHIATALVARINSALGTQIEPIFAERRAGDVRSSLADITAAREMLSYEPLVDFQTGLERSIDYYRSLIR